MGQGAIESLIHAQCLSPYCDGAAQIRIVKGLQRREKRAPALVPMGEQLRFSDGPRLELLLTVAPGLLAVAREEICEARAQVPAEVPTDGGDRIPAAWSRSSKLTVAQLGERTFASYAAADGAIYLRTETQLYRIQTK